MTEHCRILAAVPRLVTLACIREEQSDLGKTAVTPIAACRCAARRSGRRTAAGPKGEAPRAGGCRITRRHVAAMDPPARSGARRQNLPAISPCCTAPLHDVTVPLARLDKCAAYNRGEQASRGRENGNATLICSFLTLASARLRPLRAPAPPPLRTIVDSFSWRLPGPQAAQKALGCGVLGASSSRLRLRHLARMYRVADGFHHGPR